MSIRKFSLQLICETAATDYVAKFATPEDVKLFIQGLIGNKPDEYFLCIHLNVKNEPIGYMEIAHGTLSETLIHPREVFKGALLNNAHSVVLAHNHPSSGKLYPSPEDELATKQLIKAGNLLGVRVLDHVIVGPYASDIYSFREDQPEYWSKRENADTDY